MHLLAARLMGQKSTPHVQSVSAIFGQFQMLSDAIRAGSALESRFRVKLAKPLPRWEYFQKIVEE